MPLVLTRIDDRLIHGQVVVGWGMHLKPDRIILCSDTIAGDQLQKDIFFGADALVDFRIEISIWNEEDTNRYLQSDMPEKEKVILLVETPAELYRLAEKGIRFDIVNVGGMHFRRGKTELAKYIYVDEVDIHYLKKLKDKKIVLQGQDVPTGKKIDLAEILELL